MAVRSVLVNIECDIVGVVQYPADRSTSESTLMSRLVSVMLANKVFFRVDDAFNTITKVKWKFRHDSQGLQKVWT